MRQRLWPRQVHNLPVTLSVKNVPAKLAERLRHRAASHHRSLQGELLAILEEAAQPTITIDELADKVWAPGLRTSADSVATIRADRDGRHVDASGRFLWHGSDGGEGESLVLLPCSTTSRVPLGNYCRVGVILVALGC